MSNEWPVEQVSLARVLPIRHKVLWPDYPIEDCVVDGDDSALHFAVTINNKDVCVASVYQDNEQVFRLRKFATLEEHQGKGIGSYMLVFIIKKLNFHGATELWCDARESALSFYQQFGFEARGASFNKKGIPYYKAHCVLKSSISKI